MSEQIEGRNAVLEAFRSGKCVDKLFILDGCQDGPIRTIIREAKKHEIVRDLDQTFHKIDELPFDFERRRMSVIVQDTDGFVSMVTKRCP